MKKLLMVAAAAIGVAVLARRLVAGRERGDFGQRIDRMPDRSPRKWLFTNIRAIRENTERILEAVEGRTEAPPGEGR